jgi:DNA-binding transcriptional ArsR family regulator
MSLYSDMKVESDKIWKALADPTRRALLDTLGDGPRTTGELVQGQPELCRTAVMKHLDQLTAAGLVVVRREGRVRWNYLNPVPIQQVCERWIAPHLRHMTGALSRLKDQAERSRDNKE